MSLDSHVKHVLHEYEGGVVRHLNEEFKRTATRGYRIADWVTARVGSWAFIVGQSAILGTWVAWNLFAPLQWRFDPPPFIGLNLLLSFQAAYAAPFLLMSANRAQQRAHMEAEIDFAINYFAEREISDMQMDLHTLREQLTSLEQDNRRLLALVEELLRRIHRDGPPSAPGPVA